MGYFGHERMGRHRQLRPKPRIIRFWHGYDAREQPIDLGVDRGLVSWSSQESPNIAAMRNEVGLNHGLQV